MDPKEHQRLEKELEKELLKRRQIELNKQRARDILLSIKFSLGSRVDSITIKRKNG